MNKERVVFYSCLSIAALVLCAILRPVLVAARPVAAKSACLSNVRQLLTATVIYAIDHNDRLPPAAHWMDSLGSYAKWPELFTCPTIIKERKKHGYAINRFLDRVEIKKVPGPEEAHLIYDSSQLARNANEYLPAFPIPGRADGLNTVGYLDGHAKSIRMAAPED